MTRKLDSDRSRRDALGVIPASSADGGRFLGETAASWPEKRPGRRVLPDARIRTILVPLDGSRVAEHALPHAMSIARRWGAAIRLVHVQSVKFNFWHSDEAIERLKRKKQAYMQSVIRRIGSKASVQLCALVIESRHISQALRQAAAGATLVVMATGGRGFVGKLIRESVSDTLLRTLPCPLLLVRGRAQAVDLASDPMPRQVLVPLDGTKSAEKAIDFAAAMGGLSGAHFTIVHFQTLEQTLGRSKRADAHGYLRSVAERLSKRLPSISGEVVISDQEIATAIVSRADARSVDCVALTKSRRGVLARLLTRSVADSVARKAKIPVLVFPPTVAEAERPERWTTRPLWSWT